MLLTGNVGPSLYSTGNPQGVRLGNTGEVVISELRGRWYEDNFRGNSFSASTPASGVPVIAAMVSPVAGGAICLLGVYNPASSKVNGVFGRTKIWSQTGLPGGPPCWNIIPAPAGILPNTGTLGINNFTGVAGGNLRFVSATALVSGGLATMLRGIGGPSSSAAVSGLASVEENTDGDVILQPGMAAIIAVPASGTNWVVGASVTYVETPTVQ